MFDLNDKQTREYANAVWNYVTRGVDEREAAADKRTEVLARVHEKGWKLVADAINRGLSDIANALRDQRR